MVDCLKVMFQTFGQFPAVVQFHEQQVSFSLTLRLSCPGDRPSGQLNHQTRKRANLIEFF